MRSINISSESNRIIKFINKTVTQAGFKQVVLGLSGGVDSAVVAALAVQALGKENIHIALMPYGKLNTAAQKNALTLIKQLQIPENHIHEIDLTPIVQELSKSLDCQPEFFCHPRAGGDLKIPDQVGNDRSVLLNKVRLGNVIARIRMITLFDFAKKLPALVIGTENKSEHMLGYFTRFGDQASDIEPIQHLYKTEIFTLAKYLKIPESIIHQAPSANLWKAQTDEGEFGFTYEEADEIIYQLFEVKGDEKDLIKQGIDKETTNKVKSWIKKMSFKHKTPYKLT